MHLHRIRRRLAPEEAAQAVPTRPRLAPEARTSGGTCEARNSRPGPKGRFRTLTLGLLDELVEEELVGLGELGPDALVKHVDDLRESHFDVVGLPGPEIGRAPEATGLDAVSMTWPSTPLAALRTPNGLFRHIFHFGQRSGRAEFDVILHGLLPRKNGTSVSTNDHFKTGPAKRPLSSGIHVESHSGNFSM